MTSEYIAILNRLSAAEIAILIGLHPTFCLPRQAWRWRQRMDEAYALIQHDAAKASPAWRVDRSSYLRTDRPPGEGQTTGKHAA